MDSIASLPALQKAPPQTSVVAPPDAPEGGFAAALARHSVKGLAAPAAGPGAEPAPDALVIEADLATTTPASEEAAVAIPMLPQVALLATPPAPGAEPASVPAHTPRGLVLSPPVPQQSPAPTPDVPAASTEAANTPPILPGPAPQRDGATRAPRPASAAPAATPALPADDVPTVPPDDGPEPAPPAMPIEGEAALAEPAQHGRAAAERAREAKPDANLDGIVMAALAPTAVAAVAAPTTPRPMGREASAASATPVATAQPHPAEAAAVATPSEPAATPPQVATPPPTEGALRGLAPPHATAERPTAPATAEASPPAVTPPATTPLHDARAPDAPPTATPVATPARQLAPVLVSVAIAGGTARLSVTLEPAELGRVAISIDRTGDTAEVRVVAERPETLMLLQRDQRELDRALTQAGIGTEGRSMSFSLSDGGAGGFGGGRDGGAERLARGMRGSGSGVVEGTALAEAPPPRRLLSLIDLAV